MITMFAECFLYSMNTFVSLEKINKILVHDRRNMGQFVLNQNQALSFNSKESQDDRNDYFSSARLSHFTKFIILLLVVIGCNKLSQSMDDDLGKIFNSLTFIL